MENSKELLRITSDNTLYIEGKLVDDKIVEEVLSKLKEFITEKKEEELLKKGQIVWVRDNNGSKWSITHFTKKENGKYLCSVRNNEKDLITWNFLTTKNPYKEEDREPQVGDMVFAWNEENFLDLTYDIYVSYGTGINRVYKVGNKVFKHCSLKNPLIK